MKRNVSLMLIFTIAASLILGAVPVFADGLPITKDPQGETVEEGGEAMFTAICEEYSAVEWRVVTPDGETCWRGKEEIEADYGFPGVTVTTYYQDGKEYLVLSNIPVSMDYYYIQAKFWSLDGTETDLTATHSCLLRVTVNGELQTSERETTDPDAGEASTGTTGGLAVPVITLNPSDVQLESGKTTVISVSAIASDGNEVHYQWYKNTEASNITGTAIPGATTPDYMPSETPGTVWYYCSVCATNGTATSDPVTSATAAVTYPDAEPEEPAGVSAYETSDGTADSAAAVSGSVEKDNTFMVAMGAVIIAAIGCGTAIFISMNKKQSKRGEGISTPETEEEKN